MRRAMFLPPLPRYARRGGISPQSGRPVAATVPAVKPHRQPASPATRGRIPPLDHLTSGTALAGLSTLCPRRRSSTNRGAVGKGWTTPCRQRGQSALLCRGCPANDGPVLGNAPQCVARTRATTRVAPTGSVSYDEQCAGVLKRAAGCGVLRVCRRATTRVAPTARLRSLLRRLRRSRGLPVRCRRRGRRRPCGSRL